METAKELLMNDGHTIPQLGLGVWQVPEADAERVVLEAIGVGYRHIDSAQAYENEAGVGRAVRACPIPREELFVTSKVRNKLQGYDSTLRGFDESLNRMGLDYLDLFLIHWPYPAVDRYVETWKALIQIRESGRVRSIGVSNFQPEHLDRIIGETGITPAVNQVELHIQFQQRELRAYHQKLGIITQSWSPLGRGRALADPTVVGIAKAHGKTPAQVLLRWHLDSGLVTFPKSVHLERLRENFDLFDFQLSPDELQQLQGLDSPKGRFGPKPEELDVAF
ncbi:MAG TPA: aldo/keto reductase [Planctomycetota bacterium]|nr:aldo/keto reductase [Planctomycetota bacterium]HPF15099.1 aldo/keto reductase [Planctomycetota bacterium]HRV80122.1 aldo/keto reductase [Planctomycetota bacterium]